MNKNLLEKAFYHFKQYEKEEYVVAPSLPILYFGDTSKYLKSKLKVITVGKNPSNVEFRLKSSEKYSFIRFPEYNNDIKSLEITLNNYFKNKPYNKWFNSFEPFLNGMGCSFYDGEKTDNVIHTDICSPLPTDPTWTKLSHNTQNIIFKEGFKLWKELILELKPDLVVISIARKYLGRLKLNKISNVYSLKNTKDGKLRSKPYDLELFDLEIGSFKTKLVYGNAANMPFGTVSSIEKKKMGSKLKSYLTNLYKNYND